MMMEVGKVSERTDNNNSLAPKDKIRFGVSLLHCPHKVGARGKPKHRFTAAPLIGITRTIIPAPSNFGITSV